MQSEKPQEDKKKRQMAWWDEIQEKISSGDILFTPGKGPQRLRKKQFSILSIGSPTKSLSLSLQWSKWASGGYLRASFDQAIS